MIMSMNFSIRLESNLLASLFLRLLYPGTSHIRGYVTNGSYSVLKVCIFLPVKALVLHKDMI